MLAGRYRSERNGPVLIAGGGDDDGVDLVNCRAPVVAPSQEAELGSLPFGQLPVLVDEDGGNRARPVREDVIHGLCGKAMNASDETCANQRNPNVIARHEIVLSSYP